MEKQREAKRGKARIESKSNSAIQDIQMRFSLFNPQKEIPLKSHAGGKVRILPNSVRPPPEPSQGMQILANSGLRNREVCKLQVPRLMHGVLNVLTLYCTVEFNKSC